MLELIAYLFRRTELGIRMVVGASPRQVLGAVLRRRVDPMLCLRQR